MPEHSSWIGVIDDDSSLRRALGRLIRSFGFEVKLFASAYDYLNESHPEPACLIIDIVMSDMNGLDLLAELQRSGRSVPAVLISAHENEVFMARARSLGVIACLPKPCEETALLDAIQKALSSNQTPDN